MSGAGAPGSAPTARDLALAEIAELPLTENEWLAVMAIALMLRLGCVSVEVLRSILSPGQHAETVRPPAAAPAGGHG